MDELGPPPHSIRHLVRLHREVIQLLQLRQVPDHGDSVQLAVVLHTGVLLQPDALELGQVSQPADFGQVRNLVLADVQFLEVAAVLNVGQGGDAVDAVVKRKKQYKEKELQDAWKSCSLLHSKQRIFMFYSHREMEI